MHFLPPTPSVYPSSALMVSPFEILDEIAHAFMRLAKKLDSDDERSPAHAMPVQAFDEVLEFQSDLYICIQHNSEIRKLTSASNLLSEVCELLELGSAWETLDSSWIRFTALLDTFDIHHQSHDRVCLAEAERTEACETALKIARQASLIRIRIQDQVSATEVNRGFERLRDDDALILRAVLALGGDRTYVPSRKIADWIRKQGDFVDPLKSNQRLKAGGYIETQQGCGSKLTQKGLKIAQLAPIEEASRTSDDLWIRSCALGLVYFRNTSHCNESECTEEPIYEQRSKAGTACPAISSD